MIDQELPDREPPRDSFLPKTTPQPAEEIPSHLGFDYGFLTDHEFLPPFVGASDHALFGASCRLRRRELSRVVTMHGRRDSRVGLRPHEIAMPEFWGLFAHDHAPRNLLLP